MAILQGGEPGLRVEFTLADGRSLKVQPAPAGDWFNPSRGFYFEPSRIKQKAASVAAAIKSGAVETADATLIIFSILGKLGSQISPTQLSGPVGIAQAAFYAAEEGIPRLLLLLTAISANLAVINFLPIPVLDGGLMVFMVWEAIRGKPASEKAQVILTYIGLLFIVGLMFFVLALDIGVIPRATSIGGLFVAA
jgi:regulator of sigma E protease